MKYVIIGNSVAATYAVEGIRSRDKEGEIIIISAENRPSYGRPLISYYLGGKTTTDKMQYRSPRFYEENNAQVTLGVRVTKINPKNKTINLSDNQIVEYDKLLVATGSRPLLFPIEGLESVRNKFTFMTMDDALSLEKCLSPEKRVLILGAGLIGLKCAEGIFHRVKEVTVVDLADRVLPSILDGEASRMVQDDLQSRGMKFYLGDTVQSFEKGKARLKSGAVVPFDVFVMAAGVRPETDLIKEAGGLVEKGIVVNERQETSLPDIYAAGDNCESFDVSAKKNRILAILPNAALQGECAGKNMAGERAMFLNAVPVNAIGFFGSHIVSAGVYEGESYAERGNNTYKRLFYKDNALKGFLLVNDIARAGIYTSLIREMTPLNDVDFELLKKEPMLMAFSKETRQNKLTRRKL